jgi:hypothetical protein
MKPEDVTKEMREAGDAIASLLISADACRAMHGLGGARTVGQLLVGADARSIELVSAYLDGRADSATCIFLAMLDKCNGGAA